MKYYKTAEFASLIGVSATTVRAWESKGMLLPHHRSPSGYRFYSEKQVAQYLNGQFTNAVQVKEDES